jgi:hypothetical protein
MWMLTASSFVIGVLLATKFRVFILLPMIILGAVTILLANMFHPLTEICSEIVSYAIALQLGYLVGASAHHGLPGDHAPPAHPNLSTGRTLAPPAH